jgi:hypothetical protein
MPNPTIPNFGSLLGPTLTLVPDASRPGVLALLERTAADRYRFWATQSEELAAGLLECAGREDQIADRVEQIFPIAPEDQTIVADALPKAREIYYGAFEGHSLEDQLIMQAHAERQGSKAWAGLAAQATDDAIVKELLACAELEVESASHLDEALGTISADPPASEVRSTS